MVDRQEALIDPHIKDAIDTRFMVVFTEIAYLCISMERRKPPKRGAIKKMIFEAMADQLSSLERFIIPLEEIKRATDSFNEKNLIGVGTYGKVYRGQLSERWQNCTAAIKCLEVRDDQGMVEFHRELRRISSFHHENIISFIGYCDEEKQMIIVSEYASNGSLSDHLEDEDKMSCITWAQRLKICLGIARGLNYLHSGRGEHNRVIHRNLKSGNILLDENLEAKICDFGFSKSATVDTQVVRGTPLYLDSVYSETGIPPKELDIFSFGVILFEILSGTPVYGSKSYGDVMHQHLISLVRLKMVDRPEALIDPHIKDAVDTRSTVIITEIVYLCISMELEEHPSTGFITDRINEALKIQESSLKNFIIPLKEIRRATDGFNENNLIGEGTYGKVYRGQLSECWGNCTAAIKCLQLRDDQGMAEFHRELKMISSLRHQNIICFIGYCEEEKQMIIVSEYASKGSLDDHLEDEDKMSCITWAQRLKICLGIARGLNHLHSGLGDHNRVIHRDLKSGNILLDENLEAKICDFGLSKSAPINQADSQLYTCVGGTPFYLDPIYSESSILRKESDIYSFGVILFEMLSGTPVYVSRSYGDVKHQHLISLVRWLVNRYRMVDRREALIDPHIKDATDTRSTDMITEIAYLCISMELKERPKMFMIIDKINEALKIQTDRDASTITIQSHQYQEIMSSSGLKLEEFLIPLEEITLATKNFSSETQIGDGGFGKVYRGQLSERWDNRMAAIKRLDHEGYQGKKEFLNELKIYSGLQHQNIIHFIGYCVEGNEIIIVLEYASNRSLDQHLRDCNKRRIVTWAQRLRICLGVAIGLNHLHSGLDNNTTIIFTDVKSGNILLDDNMEAKICDFGLSYVCPTTDQPGGGVQTLPSGTQYYIDPIYEESSILRKESDVYSLGVVMFEMLSGMLAYHKRSYDDGKQYPLMDLVRCYYDNNGLDKLIDPHIKDHMVVGSYDTFKEIACKCISLNLTERPTMAAIIEGIRKALNIQETIPVLTECLIKDAGFSQGKPVAAFTIHKCLLHWKSFETEGTIVFDRLVNMFDLAIEKEDSNSHMAYWLSNLSALLCLIQGSLISDDSGSMVATAIEVVQAVPKHTALSFKHKLAEDVEYLYDIIRGNLIKELGTSLTLCIQAPRTTPRRVLAGGQSIGKDHESNHWQRIVDCLNALHNTMKENFVPPVIVGKMFSEIFTYVNIQVFHSILLYRECCTFRNGEHVKIGLKELQQWCWQAKDEYVSSAMEKLMHLRQTVTLLVTLNEEYAKQTLVDISEDICPSLNLQQIYRICTIYRDENNKIPDVTQHVISSIKMRWAEDFKNEDINSFILEDYSSKPFSLDDLFTSLEVKDFAGVEPPIELAEYPALYFLFH